jgi:hypothetical protein
MSPGGRSVKKCMTWMSLRLTPSAERSASSTTTCRKLFGGRSFLLSKPLRVGTFESLMKTYSFWSKPVGFVMSRARLLAATRQTHGGHHRPGRW